MMRPGHKKRAVLHGAVGRGAPFRASSAVTLARIPSMGYFSAAPSMLLKTVQELSLSKHLLHSPPLRSRQGGAVRQARGAFTCVIKRVWKSPWTRDTAFHHKNWRDSGFTLAPGMGAQL